MSAVFDLKARLEEMGLSPKKAFGQNFLVSSNVIGKIVAAAQSKPFSDLIEIGPGLGALTEPMLEAGLNPRLIELDRDLIVHWRSRGCDVIDNDALKVDWAGLGLRPNSLLVSNLPYQISTHLVIDRCFGPMEISRMVLMFQKEVAERLTAKPRTKEYGLLSVMAQTFFQMDKVSEAGPKDFFPPPKVASRVLSFTRRPGAGPGERFLTLLKAGFAFRRKFLLKNLKGVVDKSTMERLPEIWKSLGLKDQARAEELNPEKWRELYTSLYERN